MPYVLGPYVLGIDLGPSDTAAAVCPLDGPGTPEIVPLGRRAATVSSALHLRADGSVAVDEISGGSSGGFVATGFVSRVGDDVPQVVGGQQYRPQDLAAALAAWVVDRATGRYGAPPERVVLTHPAGWGPHRYAVLRQALHRHDLGAVTLVPAPVAAAHTVAPGVSDAQVAVLDVGADTIQASVVGRRPDGLFELVGPAETADAPGGALFTDGPDAAGGPVEPVLRVWVEALARSVRGSGARPGAVLLVGGPCRVPSVARLAGSRLSCRPVVEPDPELTVARGAALAALSLIRPPADPGPSSHPAVGASVGRPSGHPSAGPMSSRPPAGHPSAGPSRSGFGGSPGPSSGPVAVGPPPASVGLALNGSRGVAPSEVFGASDAFTAPPPRPPVDISPPELAPPRSLAQLVSGRPLVLAAMGAVGVVGVALTLMFLPHDDVGGTTTSTTPPAAGVPQPPGVPQGPGR